MSSIRRAAFQSRRSGSGYGVCGEGSVIGDYRLLQEIGEGGMGQVFMADQLEPIQRRVAVKIIKADLRSCNDWNNLTRTTNKLEIKPLLQNQRHSSWQTKKRSKLPKKEPPLRYAHGPGSGSDITQQVVRGTESTSASRDRMAS